ncbi:MAG: GyrI-like domain-containing protein [Devosia sp.]
MEKIDFKKTLKALYAPAAKDFALVEVPRMQFVKVDGHGNPNAAPAYKAALEWLYGVSYALKFAAKALGKDYGVPPLEGLWWAEDNAAFTAGAKDQWNWTMMIMAPEFVTPAMFEAAVAKTGKKLGEPPASLRLEPFDEGLSVQILHIGSYDDEAPTIRRLHHEFIPQNGLVENGVHHEIYLSDPRKTEPARLKTILRHPVRRQ